ncbi:MAG: hypothetical protein JWM68_71 [Verrucomicrobiales bacterium]|nr:hypothetical protein [Verrucomicrobiales bacterium]
MRSLIFRSGFSILAGFCFFSLSSVAAEKARWFKGNTHTHSFWSDGDEFPEMIADWYKTHQYDFLAFSDHNSVQDGEKWLPINDPNRPAILKKYITRFGVIGVEQEKRNGTNYVRLKKFQEFEPLFQEKGKFLLLRGEEISASVPGTPLHIGAVNVTTLIEPHYGSNVANITEVIDQNLAAIFEQRKKTRQPVLGHVNHPNFQWAITAEELMAVKNEHFFEVFNGHPHVHNDGDATHSGTERIWDIMLTHRLTDLKLPVVYGIATDDCHHYQVWGARKNNPGEGWVMVRAKTLSAKSLIEAMEQGDFYASSGVTLRDVRRDKKTYTVEVEPTSGVDYTIQFIGTRAGFDPKSEAVLDKNGTALRVSRRYSPSIGEVFQEVKGTAATYTLKGDEIYVRAKIVSSKMKYPEAAATAQKNSMETFESAWTQPLVNAKVKLASKN